MYKMSYYQFNRQEIVKKEQVSIQGLSQFLGAALESAKIVGDHGWHANRILGFGTAKTVNFGPFSTRLDVFLSQRTALPTLTID